MKNGYLLLGLGAAGLAAYLLHKRYVRDNVVDKLDDSASNNGARALKPNPTSSNNLTQQEQLTIEGLNYGIPYSINPRNVKDPIRVKRRNLIPDIYGNVGQDIGFDGSGNEGFYHNMSGKDTVNLQVACKCAPGTQLYKTDIPKLP